MVLIGLEWSLQEGTRISRGEQTLTQHQNTLHQVNLRPFTHVVSRFLALPLFAVFASPISGFLFLLHCRVSTVTKVVLSLPGASDQGNQWL